MLASLYQAEYWAVGDALNAVRTHGSKFQTVNVLYLKHMLYYLKEDNIQDMSNSQNVNT